jgi:hypothetical protein
MACALMTAIFFALSSGELSGTFNSARADLQGEIRRTLDWIVNDIRQTVSWEVANNSPSASYIKFRQVQGWNTATDTFLLSTEYITYTYDSGASTITRRLLDAGGNTLQSWTFNNIIQAPFGTLNSSGLTVPLNSGDLLTSRKIIVSISGQSQIRGRIIDYALTEKVKIRNE